VKYGLTHQLGLLELRVRRIDRVTRHVTLLILAFSLLKLAKLRASPYVRLVPSTLGKGLDGAELSRFVA
jgi:hypothetical protein